MTTKQDFRELEGKLVQLEYRLIIKLSAVMGAMLTLAVAIVAIIIRVN